MSGDGPAVGEQPDKHPAGRKERRVKGIPFTRSRWTTKCAGCRQQIEKGSKVYLVRRGENGSRRRWGCYACATYEASKTPKLETVQPEWWRWKKRKRRP
jgi:hypothetical protein